MWKLLQTRFGSAHKRGEECSSGKRTQNHFSWCTNQSFLHFFFACTIKHSQSLWCKYLLFNLFIRIIHSIDEMKRTENERGCSAFSDCHVPQYLNILPWSQTRCFFAAFSRLLCVREKRRRRWGRKIEYLLWLVGDGKTRIGKIIGECLRL